MGFLTRYLTLLVAALALPYQAALANAGTLAVPTRTAQTAPNPGTLTLSVYPNPGHGLVSVQLNAPAGPDYKLRLNNVLGRELRLVALRPDLAAEGVALDVSNLPAGLYFYSLLVNDKVVSTSRLTLQ